MNFVRKYTTAEGRRSAGSLRNALLRGTSLSLRVAAVLGGITALPSAAHAYQLYSAPLGDNQLRINLDTTVEYSNIYRVNDASAVLAGPNDANENDGDLNFRHGFVDNTFDVLPVLDIKWGNYGAHVSGEAFLDTSYLGRTQNNSPTTYNPYSTDNKHFTSATRNVNGQNAVLLDAFVYGTHYFGAQGDQQITLKIGRQTLLWGQSLFNVTDGISSGQAPVDVVKANSLPNAQAQQIFLPVGQVVATYQPNNWLTFQGYYQFEWEHFALEGAGSYFSYLDFLDKGGQRILLGNQFGLPANTLALYRLKDHNPPIQNGQFGFSTQAVLGNVDVGLYALRYDAKQPVLYDGAPVAGQPPNSVGSYWLAYPRDIQLYGAAFSTNLGPANVAGEINGRRNVPLVAGLIASPYPGGTNAGALYPVGSTVHLLASAIYLSPGIPFDPGGVTVDAEVVMNHVISVDKNRSMLAVGRQATAGDFVAVVTPNYYNVLPNINLAFPIGITYNWLGRSEIDSTMNHGTGDVNVGITATYASTWTAGLTYYDYFGKADPTLNPLADRGYVSFNVEHTF